MHINRSLISAHANRLANIRRCCCRPLDGAVCTDMKVMGYRHLTTSGTNAYSGGVYSPKQNRIYLVPFKQARKETWHYIDCATGLVVGYEHQATITDLFGAYSGGVFSPTQNRIYLVPYGEGEGPTWHYIDCNNGSVVGYDSPALTYHTYPAYSGGVFSPTQNRIYLVPHGQAGQETWHYINCATGLVVGYEHELKVNADGFAYEGGVYDQIKNRIYLVPYRQATEDTWHYIDCHNGSVVGYDSPALTYHTYPAYSGGVYSPNQKRIYLVPHGQAGQETWHYINCATGLVVGYEHELKVNAVPEAYEGGVYSPTEKRIYFVPFKQAPQETWHYIDCITGEVVAYQHGLTADQNGPTAVNGAYSGGVYSPTQNRIYFVPLQQSNHLKWHYIGCADEVVPEIELA